MSTNDSFFGDIFDTPEDDPLLGGENESPAEEGSPTESQTRGEGPPSWVSENSEVSRDAGTHDSAEPEDFQQTDPDNPKQEHKEIVVDQRDGSTRGLHLLNEAVADDWRLTQVIAIDVESHADGDQTHVSRFVAVLERRKPRSLFGFGEPI